MFKRTQEIRFYIWNLSIGTRTIKRDLVQGFWFETSAQENLDKYLWDTNTTQKSKMRIFILPNPYTPGKGPDTPDPIAWSVRMTVPGPKTRIAQRLFSGLRGINTPSPPSAHHLLPIWRAELIPLSPFLSDSFEGFEQGFVLVSFIPTSLALGFGQARGFKFVTLGALCS